MYQDSQENYRQFAGSHSRPCLCKLVIKAAMPPFSNENQLRSKTFLISWPNYSKNKRSSQCDYERKSKHSKCSYTCEKRRGLTGISLQSSKQIR